jgi:hypothetical protein
MDMLALVSVNGHNMFYEEEEGTSSVDTMILISSMIRLSLGMFCKSRRCALITFGLPY